MTKSRIRTGLMLSALLLSLIMSSCKDKMDEYFEVPGWIGGSIYEELQKDGNHSIFLQGIDKAGFKTIVNGKSILTVAAPDDNAMREYLQSNYGTTDINSLTDAEVKKLIGFHIMYYALDEDDMYNFRPEEGDGATDEQMSVKGGLFYKFRTKSNDEMTVERDTTTAEHWVKVYHLERYLPSFSKKMFETKGIDPQKNYNYFYPETETAGGCAMEGGFNIANAAVTEYAAIANNGYIYKVDKVLKPLETIYTELKNAGSDDEGYSTFLSLYDKYQYYAYDKNLTLEYGNGDSLFQHYHSNPLPNIACEWPETDYTKVTKLAYAAHSIFAPNNKAFTDFFNDYWGEGGYSDLSEVASSSIQKLLYNCIGRPTVDVENKTDSKYGYSMIFPEEIESGMVEDPDGKVISFDTQGVPQKNRLICSNGVLYGCNYLTPPAAFNSVSGPAYQRKDMRDFLYFIQSGGMDNVLSNSEARYIQLYADNTIVEGAGYKWNEASNALTDQNDKAIGSGTCRSYAYGHTCAPTDGNTILATSGKKVYETLNQHQYWYVMDGKLTNSIAFCKKLDFAENPEKDLDIWASFTPMAYRGDVDGWTNGHCYQYDNALLEGTFDNLNNKNIVTIMCNNRTDATSDFYGFVQLIQLAGQIDNKKATFSFWQEDAFMFIPTTEAVEKAIVRGDFEDVIELDEDVQVGQEDFFDHCHISRDTYEEDGEAEEILTGYIARHFVPLSTAVMTNYPFCGWGEDEDVKTAGGLQTWDTYINEMKGEMEAVCIAIDNTTNPDKIQVGVWDKNKKTFGKKVNVIDKYYYFPFTFNDGGVHFIDGMLK